MLNVKHTHTQNVTIKKMCEAFCDLDMHFVCKIDHCAQWFFDPHNPTN